MTHKDLVNVGREHYMADVWLYPTPTADFTKYFIPCEPRYSLRILLNIDLQEAINCSDETLGQL